MPKTLVCVMITVIKQHQNMYCRKKQMCQIQTGKNCFSFMMLLIEKLNIQCSCFVLALLSVRNASFYLFLYLLPQRICQQ